MSTLKISFNVESLSLNKQAFYQCKEVKILMRCCNWELFFILILILFILNRIGFNLRPMAMIPSIKKRLIVHRSKSTVAPKEACDPEFLFRNLDKLGM